jgi:hypothetical protein
LHASPGQVLASRRVAVNSMTHTSHTFLRSSALFPCPPGFSMHACRSQSPVCTAAPRGPAARPSGVRSGRRTASSHRLTPRTTTPASTSRIAPCARSEVLRIYGCQPSPNRKPTYRRRPLLQSARASRRATPGRNNHTPAVLRASRARPEMRKARRSEHSEQEENPQAAQGAKRDIRNIQQESPHCQDP